MKYRKPQPKKGIPVQTLTVRQRLSLMRTALPYIAFFLFLIVVGAGFLLLHLPDVEADTAGAPVRSGMATVTRKTAYGVGAKKGNFSTAVALTFRINGHFTTVNTELNEHSVLLNEGQEVVLTYQVGKSGTYYVVDWQASCKVELPR